MKKAVAILFFILWNACSTQVSHNQNEKNDLMQRKDTLQVFLQEIIEDERFDDYFQFLTDEEKTKIAFVENTKLGITDTLKLVKYQHPLKCLSFNKTRKGDVYFYFTQISKSNDTVKMKYYFQFRDENMLCTTYFVKKNQEWEKAYTRMAIID